jgi:peptidoglycan/LPS O-acetylase OafA/YrhL
LALFVFVIDPLTDFIGYRAVEGNRGLLPYLDIWWRDDADLGPAWFIAVLLGFSLAYAAWRWWRPAPSRGDGAARLGGRQLLVVGLCIVVGSFVLRLGWPFGSRAVFGLNLWELPQMVALFSLGVVSAERGWLAKGLPDRLWHRCGAAAIAGALTVPLVLALLTGRDDDPLLGGLDPRALVIPVGEAVIAIGMSLWTLDWFRRRWNHTGPVRHGLARGSFAAYLVHPPVIVLLGVALQPIAVPVELKFVVVSAFGVTGAFALGWLLTRWRPIARII